METIRVSVTIDNTISFDSYYRVTINQRNKIIDWYQQFMTDSETIQISDSLTISPESLHIDVIQDFNFDLLKDNTSNILEHIPELIDVFDNEECNSDDSDEDLYTETEKCMNLIDAHMNGERTQVSKLINSMPSNNIVKTIKKKL